MVTDGPDPPVNALTDAEVIQRSLDEPDWFAAIFERHADRILRYAHARLGADLAEDVTAETFLAAFGRRGSYDLSYPDAGPWLYGIAVRQIGRHRRAERRYRAAIARFPAGLTTMDFGDRSAERVTAEQLRPRIAAVLAGLSRQDSELLLLIAWAGLTYDEAARAVGTSTSAVRSRLNRIRVKTRKALGGANPAYETEETTHG
jgi:RNA polymerase sigma-70 factor (ECF subfamily)